MLDERSIREIFYDALWLHRQEHNVVDDKILKAIIAIQDGYAAKKWNEKRSDEPLDFDNAAFRCGYLHKYAGCHASLVQYVVKYIGEDKFDDLFSDVPAVMICCIGGGPGSDIIGLCSVFHSMPEFWHKVLHFDVVDWMIEWRKAFSSVESASYKYGNFGAFIRSRTTHAYHRADMLSSIPNGVKECIRSADLVTMVKFVSAAASEAAPAMLQAVFALMKPGAAVLFIDNAGGGFYELVSRAANRCGLVNFAGPFRHLQYRSDVFKRKMFGYFSLSSTTVAVQMWQKPCPATLNGWGSHFASQRFLDSQFKASSYGCSYSSGTLNLVGGQNVKQNIPEKKCGNSIIASASGISRKFSKNALNTETSTSQGTCNSYSLSASNLVGGQKVKQNIPERKCGNSILPPAAGISRKLHKDALSNTETTSQGTRNSLTKLMGSRGHGSDTLVSVVCEAKSLPPQSSGTGVINAKQNTCVYPKQDYTKHPTLSVNGHKNLPIRSGVKELGSHCNSSGAKSNTDTRSSLGVEVQAVTNSSLDSVPERHFRNRRDEESICCCIIL